MGLFADYIGEQFGNPHGFIGFICCRIMNAINAPMYRAAVDALSITPHNQILDIGYGNGQLLRLLYRRYAAELSGIDISEDMRQSAEKRNQTAKNAGKLHLSLGDCCKMQFPDAAFDAVTSVNTIYFWQNTLQGLREIHRVLRPGGVFCNAVYTKEWLSRTPYTQKNFRLFSPEDYITLGKQAGFTDVQIQAISGGKRLLVLFRR